ncbi:MAG: hypothetical protein LAP38_25320 [Acidobacteriia bacterium]|nr:hypothetical protein [Terriglobia bacterium]
MLRQALVLLIVVVVFGILVPWYKGFTFLQPWILTAYASMALLFVAPAAAEFWSANPPPDSTRAVLARIFVPVGFGWGVSVLMLVTAVVTLNLAYWGGRVLIPPQGLMASVLVFSLTASTAVAALCAVLGLRLPALTVKSILRVVFLLVLLVLAFGSRFLPESWQIVLSDHSTRRAITRMGWEGSGVAVVAAAGLLTYLVRNRGAERTGSQ